MLEGVAVEGLGDPPSSDLEMEKVKLTESNNLNSETNISILNDINTGFPQNGGSSWNQYNDYLVNDVLQKQDIPIGKAEFLADLEMFWPALGYSFEHLYLSFREYQGPTYKHNSEEDFMIRFGFGKLLYEAAILNKHLINDGVSLQLSTNHLLNFLQLCMSRNSDEYVKHILQVDGTLDLGQDVPKCLGNLDCDNTFLFHAVTIFRGFEELWPCFEYHNLCECKENQTIVNFCAFCLLRSFCFRVNDMRLSGGKRDLKPVELMWILPKLLESNSNPSPIKLFITLLQDVKRINENRQGWQVNTQNCSRKVRLPYFWEVRATNLDKKVGDLNSFIYQFVKKAIKCECDEEQFKVDTEDSNILILYLDEPQVFNLKMSFLFEGGFRYLNAQLK